MFDIEEFDKEEHKINEYFKNLMMMNPIPSRYLMKTYPLGSMNSSNSLVKTLVLANSLESLISATSSGSLET